MEQRLLKEAKNLDIGIHMIKIFLLAKVSNLLITELAHKFAGLAYFMFFKAGSLISYMRNFFPEL